MTIREAASHDVEAIVAMGVHFIAGTTYGDHLSINPLQLRDFAGRCVSGGLGESAILLSEEDGVTTGMIGLLVAPHPFSGDRTASELFWWVEPSHRGHGLRLMRAAEAWAVQHGAARLQMVAPNERVAKLYRARGYTQLESTYQRSL